MKEAQSVQVFVYSLVTMREAVCFDGLTFLLASDVW